MSKNQSWERRLTPEMVAFRLLVLAFVRDYFGQWRSSPSYGEIANALDSTRPRVRKALKSLVKDGLLHRVPGPRGLSLPTLREEALKLLRDQGYTIDEGFARIDPPTAGAVTDHPLPPAVRLSYPENGPSLSQDGDPDDGAGQCRAGQNRAGQNRVGQGGKAA